MDEFEERFFFLLLEKNPDELLEVPKTKAEKDTPLNRLNAQLMKINFAIGQTTKLVGELPIDELKTKLSDLDNERLKLKTQIQGELTKQAATAANPNTIRKFKEIFAGDDMEDWVANAEHILEQLQDDKIRVGLRNILPSLVKSIDVNFSSWEFAVTFTNGARTELGFDV